MTIFSGWLLRTTFPKIISNRKFYWCCALRAASGVVHCNLRTPCLLLAFTKLNVRRLDLSWLLITQVRMSPTVVCEAMNLNSCFYQICVFCCQSQGETLSIRHFFIIQITFKSNDCLLLRYSFYKMIFIMIAKSAKQTQRWWVCSDTVFKPFPIYPSLSDLSFEQTPLQPKYLDYELATCQSTAVLAL